MMNIFLTCTFLFKDAKLLSKKGGTILMTRTKKSSFKKTTKNFNIWRVFLRDCFLFGFRSRNEYAEIGINGRTYDDLKKRLEICVDQSFFDLTARDGKLKFLKFKADSYNYSYNFLSNTFGTKSINNNFYLELLAIQILTASQKPLLQREIGEALENLNITDFYNITLYRSLENLESYGWININKSTKNYKYSVVSSFLDNLTLSELKELYLVTTFYKNVSMLTLPGYYLMATLEDFAYNKFGAILKEKDFFQFRFNNFSRLLDETVIYIIQQAITNGHNITYSTKNSLGNIEKPVKIITKYPYNSQKLVTETGKELLLYKLNDISCTQKEILEQHHSKKTKGKQCIEIVFTFLPTDDSREVIHIKNRIMEETLWMTCIEKTENRWIFRANVKDSLSYVPWLRTYHKYISFTKNTYPKLVKKILDDKAEALANYGNIF